MTVALNTCYVCGNSENNVVYRVPEMMFGFRDEFAYFECSKCGCLQIKEIPSNMSKYYPSNYYSYSKIPEKKPSGIMGFAKKTFRRRKNKYEIFGGGLLEKVLYQAICKLSAGPTGFSSYSALSKVPLNHNSRILDVGCGSGLLLYVVKNLGFENVLGTDPFIESPIKYENGLNIIKEPIQNIQGKWDLVMFHHSFEHIPDQRETLNSVHRLLNNGGTCIIRVPTTSSYAWRHYRINWVQLDAPRHFFLHSTKSLELLAKEASLKLKHIEYDSNAFQFWGSEQYAMGIPLLSPKSYNRNPNGSVFSKEQIIDFNRKAEELNNSKQGDSAAFFLCRS